MRAEDRLMYSRFLFHAWLGKKNQRAHQSLQEAALDEKMDRDGGVVGPQHSPPGGRLHLSGVTASVWSTRLRGLVSCDSTQTQTSLSQTQQTWSLSNAARCQRFSLALCLVGIWL